MSEKNNKRLGRGVDALFSETSEKVPTENENIASRVLVSGVNDALEKLKEGAIDEAVLKQAVAKVRAGKPVTSVWSQPIKVTLQYLFLTVPSFKESVEAQKMLEEKLKTKYSELWKAVQQALQAHS